MGELPPPQVGADEARDLADNVLSGRAYVEAARPPSLQQRLFNWIGDLIADLLNALSSTGGRGVTAWLMIIAFGLLIAYLLSRLVKNSGPLPSLPAGVEPVIDVFGGRSSDEWLAAAVEAEAGGDWRLGVRCRHRSLAASLVRAGIITDRPGQTAGEIERMLSQQRPGASRAMQQATSLFKDTWYGWIEATPSTRDDFAALAEEVLAAQPEPLVSA